MNKNNKSASMYIVLAIVAMVFISSVFLSGPATDTTELSYSDFIQRLDAGEFSKIEKADDFLIAIPKNQPKVDEQKKEDSPINPFGIETKAPQKQYKVLTPKDDSGNLMNKIDKSGVDLSVKKPSESMQMMGLLSSLFLPILFIVFLIVLAKSIQAGGSQAMSFGKSKAKMLLDSNVKTTFKDVAGIDEERK